MKNEILQIIEKWNIKTGMNVLLKDNKIIIPKEAETKEILHIDVALIG